MTTILSRSSSRMMWKVVSRRVMILTIGAILLFLPVLTEALGEPFVLVTTTRIMVLAMAALSLDLILGYGGMVSFGHAAFLGIGAYAVAILSANGIDDFLLQLGAGILVAAVFALATGAIALRTTGVYFIMITLAFAQMAYFFVVSLSSLGGDDGYPLAQRATLLGTDFLSNDLHFFYVVLALLALIYALLSAVIASRFGRVLRGISENPERMAAIGFRPYPYKLAAYVLSGGLAGASGVLLAYQANFVAPAYLSWQRSGELIVMVALGGMGTLFGPVMGAFSFMLLEQEFSRFSEHWKLGVGLVLILLVLRTRGGLASLFPGGRGEENE